MTRQEKMDKVKPLLEEAAVAQTMFWQALKALDGALGDDMDVDGRVDLAGYELGYFVDDHCPDEPAVA